MGMRSCCLACTRTLFNPRSLYCPCVCSTLTRWCLAVVTPCARLAPPPLAPRVSSPPPPSTSPPLPSIPPRPPAALFRFLRPAIAVVAWIRKGWYTVGVCAPCEHNPHTTAFFVCSVFRVFAPGHDPSASPCSPPRTLLVHRPCGVRSHACVRWGCWGRPVCTVVCLCLACVHPRTFSFSSPLPQPFQRSFPQDFAHFGFRILFPLFTLATT
jgi:hypothetical protein